MRQADRSSWRRIAGSVVRRQRSLQGWARALRHPSAQRDTVVHIGKSAFAAGLAWEAAARLLHGPSPFYAPLAALLTVYSTVYRTAVAAVQRVVGVLLGILLAYLLARALPLNGFTVAAVVCLALVVSRWRRLGDQSSQVPVTALLLLLIGRSDPSEYALARLAETALGVGVGLLVNLTIAPPTHLRAATDAVQNVADSLAELLAETAQSLTTWPPADNDERLRRASQLPREVASAREALTRARDSQRFNPRHPSSRTSVAAMNATLDTLEHITVLTRTSVRTLHDAANDQVPLDEQFLQPYRQLLCNAGHQITAAIQSVLAGIPDADSDPPAERSVVQARQQVETLAGQVTSVAARPAELLTYTSLLAELDRLFAQLSSTPIRAA